MESLVEDSAAARKEKRPDQNLGKMWDEKNPPLVEQALLDASVGVDAAVAEEWPMGRVRPHASIRCRRRWFLSIDARLGENLAARRDDKALAPEFDPISTGRRLVPTH